MCTGHTTWSGENSGTRNSDEHVVHQPNPTETRCSVGEKKEHVFLPPPFPAVPAFPEGTVSAWLGITEAISLRVGF